MSKGKKRCYFCGCGLTNQLPFMETELLTQND
jgi:hypothetical protein